MANNHNCVIDILVVAMFKSINQSTFKKLTNNEYKKGYKKFKKSKISSRLKHLDWSALNLSILIIKSLQIVKFV